MEEVVYTYRSALCVSLEGTLVLYTNLLCKTTSSSGRNPSTFPSFNQSCRRL